MKLMKRIAILTLALLLIVSGAHGGVIYAAGVVSGSDTPPEIADGDTSPDEPEIEDPATPEVPASKETSIAIDSKNVYEGMDKSYEKGYIPTVTDGKAALLIKCIINIIFDFYNPFY